LIRKVGGWGNGPNNAGKWTLLGGKSKKRLGWRMKVNRRKRRRGKKDWKGGHLMGISTGWGDVGQETGLELRAKKKTTTGK